MTHAVVTLVEYGAAVDFDGDEDLAHRLVQEGEAWKTKLGLQYSPLEVTSYRGKISVRARDVSGFLRVGETELEIAPKFLDGESIATGEWRLALWRILTAIDNEPVLAQSTLADDDPSRSLPDLMARTFLASVVAGRQAGMPRGYAEQHGRLAVLRGRLDPAHTADLVLRPWAIDCVYDEYVEDIPVNRLLRWAAQALAADVLSGRLHRVLLEQVSAMSDVGIVPPGILEAERIVLPPQHRELEPAVEIARLLLRGRNLVHRQGRYDVQGFLWKSSEVFETFVFRLMRRVARSIGGLRVTKESIKLGVPVAGTAVYTFSTEPDVRVSDSSGTTKLILDAKYKNWTSNVPGRNDRYQVITGGWASECEHVGLVYPAPSGIRRGPMRWTLSGASVPLDLAAVFVNLPEMAKASGERQLAEELRDDLSSFV